MQYGFHGGDNQLWDISYDRNSGQAIITSKLDENLVLSIEDDGGPGQGQNNMKTIINNIKF